MCELLMRWIEKYPIVSIEDPLAEDDPGAFARFTKDASLIGPALDFHAKQRCRFAHTLRACSLRMGAPGWVKRLGG